MLPTAQPPAGLSAHQFPRRVIIHVDLDCFYCQVEQKRLNIPADVPCAVQQWEGLIAVNYAARAAGITRHMRVGEAKKKCPELQLVHVQTIGGEDAAPAAGATHVPTTATPSGVGVEDATTVAPAAAAAQTEGSAADRGSSKACLQRYRKASAQIMRLLASTCPGCAFEKASIDEAYMDVTQLAVQELSQAEAVEGGLPDLCSRAAEASNVLGGGGLLADVEFDRLAAAGGIIALRLRSAVFDQLGFTCSAGVGPNKLLAKIASAKHKPNKQTLVLPRAVESLMQDLPLGKVKGLGGKLGSQLEGLGATTAGAAAGLSWEVLVDAFGSKALWVWETVRGIESDPVTPKSLVKSINSCKSFEPTSDLATVTRWLGVLAAELAERMAEDEADNTRRARTLVLQYRTSSVRNAADRSVRGGLPRCGREGYTTQCIADAGVALFKRITPAPFPLVRLALAATEFADLPGHGSGGSSAALARFLATGAQQQQQQHGLQQEQQGQHEPNLQAVHHPQQPAGAAVSQAPQAPHQQLQQRHTGSSKQRPPGQTRLEQFVQQQPATQTAAAHRDLQQPAVQQHHSQHPAVCHAQLPAGPTADMQQARRVSALQPATAPYGSGAVHQPCNDSHGQACQDHSSPHPQQGPCPQAMQSTVDTTQQQQGLEEHGQQAVVPAEEPCVDSLPQQQQQQQQESVEQLAALAGVDVAGQAHIMRDIEIQSMLTRRHQQQQAGRQAGTKKRKGNQQQHGQQGGKQMRISSLFQTKQ